MINGNFFSNWAHEAQTLKKELLRLVDADTSAFEAVMLAMGLPKKNPEEINRRQKKLEEVTVTAMRVPFQVMKLASRSMILLRTMADTGNPNSVSDAGVGVWCARAAIQGAYLNVRINATGYQQLPEVKQMLQDGAEISERSGETEKEIMAVVNAKLNGV